MIFVLALDTTEEVVSFRDEWLASMGIIPERKAA